MTVGNIGSAILLIAILWFGYHYGFSLGLYLLGILPLLTWAYDTGAKETKRLIAAQTQYYEAKARYLGNKGKQE